MINPTPRRTGEPFSAAACANSGVRSVPEPIAIVGLGCRFPGESNSWQDYWRLLESGTDAISQTPSERWDLQKFYAPNTPKPGKTQSKWGGYVRDIDAFDPQLFGISPREAASMDPQQRMLLEVAFRALEDGGQPLEKLAGQPVSVFVGISSFDYAVASLSFRDRGVIDAYSNTGGSSSIAANRISYCFDLRGPSVAVDTACSSSLVAVHMACESIWRGEAAMALAGGVNALLLPDFYVAFSQLGVLSPDGRCKSFDARANGYVRSEGAGMALLKPLSAALRERDTIYAVVRATALNQDGRTPGMTVPSGDAQQRLIKAACEKAGIDPSQLSYVEAHGTGTPVGDPIEAAAIGSVVARPADAGKCLIGSVKTNIGHLEAGAGIASLIKVALALHHRQIPAHLHFKDPNPAIDWQGLGLEVPTRTVPWSSEGPRLAGINGFGYGGANAHVILEQAPETADQPWHAPQGCAAGCSAAGATPGATQSKVHGEGSDTSRSTGTHAIDKNGRTRNGHSLVGSGSKPVAPAFTAPVVLPLSARSTPALHRFAGELADWLELEGDVEVPEVAGYLAHRRSHFHCRAAIRGLDRTGLIAALRELSASEADADAPPIDAGPRQVDLSRGAAFVCCGQGPQWWAMGRGLLTYAPAFRAVIKRCDAEFAKYGDWSLLEELSRDEASSRMQQTSIAQPSIFALQIALAAVWESWGVTPRALVGHSVGEIAAAYLSGGLSFEDAACVAFHRGRTMDLASSQGAMLAAGLPSEEVPQWLEGIETEVSLAAINGPSSVTISGAADAIEVLAQRLERAGVFCRRLVVEYAFHSPQMEPVREALLEALAHLQPQRTHTPMISTVSGKLIEGTQLNAEYWWNNVRQSVRFSDAMTSLAELGFRLAVEVGPHPVLAYSIDECGQQAGVAIRSVPSLNRKQDDLQRITQSLCELYELGYDIRWSGFYNYPRRRLNAPTYPFQLQSLWSESLESRIARQQTSVHPLLGEALTAPVPQWQQRVDLKLQSYLADHRVRGLSLYPAAAIVETALAAARQVRQTESVCLHRVQLHNACVLTQEQPQWIQTSWDEQRRQLQFASRACDDTTWTTLATVGIRSDAGVSSIAEADLLGSRMAEVGDRCTEVADHARLYEYCAGIGLEYGPAFRGVISGLRRQGEALVQVALPTPVANEDYQASAYCIHPALLDSCFHGMLLADENFDHTLDGLYLPAEIREVHFHRSPSEAVTVHVRLLSKTRQSMVCDLDILDASGKLCLRLLGFESRRVGSGPRAESTEDLVYSYSWIKQPLVAKTQEPNSAAISKVEPSPRHCLVFSDRRGVGHSLTERLIADGNRVVEVHHAPADARNVVDPESAAGFVQTLASAADELQGRIDHMIYLWALDVPEAEGLTVESLEDSTRLTALAPVHLIQAWESLPEAMAAELTLVTAGAQSQDGPPELTQVAAAPLVGLGRVVVSECARLRGKLVDLPAFAADQVDDAQLSHMSQILLQELFAEDVEDEVMWRGGQRYAHRFSPQAGKPVSVDAARQLPCRLTVGVAEGIDDLHYRTEQPGDLQAGEVEIEVQATGLNFSDVMKSLGLYPGLPDGPVSLGAECSGRISRLGPDCEAWQVGDEVMAVAPGAFATHVRVASALVAKKPSSLSHAQAATLPIAFLTAEYALFECGRLKQGDSVLVHSASGGVGLAALQLCKLAGVRVFATAGSEEKRAFVREMGAELVMDSRSQAFGPRTLAATGGTGVDAVLNSLPGEGIATGLSVLKTGGRFLEIGKRDIYADAALGLYPFRNNLALFAIDLDQWFKQQPARMGAMLRRIAARFESGELAAPPVEAFPADQTRDAFRLMQQGKHIGKVAVDYRCRPSEVRAGVSAPLRFREDGTYWIAGGLGGFGFEIASWMAHRGARTLVLSGRRAQPSQAAAHAIDKLRDSGVRVFLLPADITVAEDVRRVLHTIDGELPPLRGVIHSAMVLEDRLLVDLDRATLERVLRPKVLGGWNLHRETLNHELDCFVLFSSLSSVFGHAGQANYSAANALLDSLAYYRRAQGLPALVMNWGHLGEVGYLAERRQLGERLERQGVLSFSVRQATECLEYALQTKALQLSVLRIDWSIWRGLGITGRVSPRFADLLRGTAAPDVDTGESASAARVRAIGGEQRLRIVEQLVRNKASGLLGIPSAQIPADRALLELGLDSLMAVEMRNWIESQLEISVPISALMRSESLRQLVGLLCEAVDEAVLAAPVSVEAQEADPANLKALAISAGKGALQETGNATVATALEAEALLEKLPDMAADEIAHLLGQMLRE